MFIFYYLLPTSSPYGALKTYFLLGNWLLDIGYLIEAKSVS